MVQANELETLYTRFRREGDVQALAVLFDHVAPDLVRLARRLVRDPNQAEDLVQETFLTAIARPDTYDESRPLRPWLLGILANRAREERRTSEKPIDPERLHEREVPTPPGELNASEFRAAIATAVDELPENLRRVVEGRLIEGRDSKELAGELSLTPNALRQRLHRGMLMLRGLLPAGLSSSLAALFMTRRLVAVRGEVLRAGGKTPNALKAGGTVLAAGTIKAIALAGAVAVTGATLAYVSGPEAEMPGGDQVEASSHLSERGERASTGESKSAGETDDRAAHATPAGQRARVPSTSAVLADLSAADGASAEDPGRAGFVLSGHVLDGSAQPVTGAEVAVWLDKELDQEPDLSGKTDPEGRFRIEGVHSEFIAKASTGDLACVRGLRGGLQNDTTLEDGLEILVGKAQSLRGRVVAPDGSPVEGAELRVEDQLGQRDFSMLTEVPGVARFHAGNARTTSDAEGRFALEGLPPRQVYLLAEKAPFLVYREYHEASDQPVVIELDPGLTLAGRVFDATGKPAAGARVRFGPYYGNLHLVPQVYTCDTEGRFSITGLLPHEREAVGWSDETAERKRKHWIAVVHEGHALQIVQPIDPVRGSKGRRLNVHLDAEAPLTGRVVDGDGRGLADIRLTVEGPRIVDHEVSYMDPFTWETAADCQSVATDSDGNFSFPHLYANHFSLRAYPPSGTLGGRTRWGESRFLERRVRSGSRPVTIVMDEASLQRVRFFGTLRDAATGIPIDTVMLVPLRNGSGYHYEVDTRDGEYELSGLAPGNIQLSFRAEGYAELRLAPEDFAVGNHRRDVQLDPARTLRLRLVDETGASLWKFEVEAFDVAGNALWFKTGRGMQEPTARAVNGFVTLSDLPAQRLRLRARIDGRFQSFQVDLTQPIEGEHVVTVSGVRESVFRLRFDIASTGPRLVLLAAAQAATESGTRPTAPLECSIRQPAEGELYRVRIAPQGNGSFQVEQAQVTRTGSTSLTWESDSPETTLTLPEGELEFVVQRGESVVMSQIIFVKADEEQEQLLEITLPQR